MADFLRRDVEGCVDWVANGVFAKHRRGLVVGDSAGRIVRISFGLVIYLAKGGPKSGDAPYVIPSGIVTGALTGLFIWIFAIK